MRIMGAGVKGGTQIEEEAFPSPPLDVGADRSLTAPCRCYDWITCIRNDTSDISTNSTARATLALWFAPCLLDGFTAIRELKQSTSFRGCNRI